MAGIPERFFEALAHSAFESFWHGGGAARSVECNHRREAVHKKIFWLRQRLNFLDLPVAQNFCRFHVFIDQAFHAEHKLIVERWLRVFWQATNIELERIRSTANPTDKFAGQDRGHSR